jgi:hypothetical protein
MTLIEMLAVIEVKDILYATIENIGKEKIQSDIASNIKLSQKYIDIIMGECITKLYVESNTGNNEERVATLSEALLHFMLTICTLPSERKIQVKDNLTLDVVVPNLQTLKRSPDKSIIVQIIKDKMDLDKISQLESLQPSYKNIWLLCVNPLSTKKYITYGVFSNVGLYNYSNIIIDINNFLRESGDKSFRFIH